MTELKKISLDAVTHALELGERYRLLGEPDQATSICRDVLIVDPNNQTARRMLLLALTDQFARTKGGGTQHEAEMIAESLDSDYDRHYYLGVVFERWGRSLHMRAAPSHVAGDWISKAMAEYEKAAAHRAGDDDSALLRWNACARLLDRFPEMKDESPVHEMHFGD